MITFLCINPLESWIETQAENNEQELVRSLVEPEPGPGGTLQLYFER
jgi:hypothetical protein